MTAKQRPLWRCPRCGHRFVTANLWHSCGRHRLAEHFRGKDRAVRRVFDRLVALTRDCGRVSDPAQLEAAFARLVREAYRVGRQGRP